jgi:hypothetical protein
VDPAQGTSVKPQAFPTSPLASARALNPMSGAKFVLFK